MLVLTRKQNEKIRIGDNITITVVRMKGKAVRLGIEAPKNVNVLRGELLLGESRDNDADIHCEDIHRVDGHCESSEADQAAKDTIIEHRIPKTLVGTT